MVASILTILGALATILGPLLAAVVVAWADKQREDRLHATQDDIDEHIRLHLGRNRAGLVGLSHQLERLRDEARRKRHHP